MPPCALCNFEKAADLFEKAIVNYKMRNDMEINCRMRCEENPLKYAISRHLKTADTAKGTLQRPQKPICHNPSVQA